MPLRKLSEIFGSVLMHASRTAEPHAGNGMWGVVFNCWY